MAQKKAAKEVVPEIFVQYHSYESNLKDIEERIREHYFRKEVAPIESMQIYIKTEDSAAYYVINEGCVGKVNLF
ncbi:MAG: DUF6465 family protein [Wujia sp.]